jgi:hypothetical protein
MTDVKCPQCGTIGSCTCKGGPGRKALQLLKQPTLLVDEGTHYERRSTPYFVEDCASSPNEVGMAVGIVVRLDYRRSSYMGDEDDWDRSTTYAIPADWFFDVLARLQAGRDISAEGRAEIIEYDEASGADCEDPHCNVTRRDVEIMLRLELSSDMGSVTLTLLRRETGGWAQVTQLRQTDSAPPAG